LTDRIGFGGDIFPIGSSTAAVGAHAFDDDGLIADVFKLKIGGDGLALEEVAEVVLGGGFPLDDGRVSGEGEGTGDEEKKQ